jgi:hypothetical protein
MELDLEQPDDMALAHYIWAMEHVIALELELVGLECEHDHRDDTFDLVFRFQDRDSFEQFRAHDERGTWDVLNEDDDDECEFVVIVPRPTLAERVRRKRNAARNGRRQDTLTG